MAAETLIERTKADRMNIGSEGGFSVRFKVENGSCGNVLGIG